MAGTPSVGNAANVEARPGPLHHADGCLTLDQWPGQLVPRDQPAGRLVGNDLALLAVGAGPAFRQPVVRAVSTGHDRDGERGGFSGFSPRPTNWQASAPPVRLEKPRP